MEKTAVDYDQDIQAKDLEIAEAIKSKETIHQEILNLRRKKIDLDMALSKAKFNLDLLKIERTQLVSHFWHCKNQGL